MIREYFRQAGPANPSPYVDGVISIPSISVTEMRIRFLIDTGSDRTLIGDIDADRMVRYYSLDARNLEEGVPSQGIGGIVPTREVGASLHLDHFSTNLIIDVLEPTPGQQPSVPSLLGRDILSHFALFMEERTNRVLLLEPAEADSIQVA